MKHLLIIISLKMKHLWLILSFIILIQPDNFISIDEERINWFNSLAEGTFIEGENTRIIKKKENENVTIQSFGPEYITIWEYDKTGRMISIGCGTTVREFKLIPKVDVIEL